MDSGKLFIEKINIGLYLLILIAAVLNRKFNFFDPYAPEVYYAGGSLEKLGAFFGLLCSYAVLSHLASLIMMVVGLVLMLKRALEKESLKNSFELVKISLVHTLLFFFTATVIMPAFIAVT